MKNRFLAPLMVLAFLLQSAFFSKLPLFGMSADIVLAILLLLPLYYEEKQALVYAVLFGLLRDVCFGISIGPTALLYAVLVWLVSHLRSILYADQVYTAPLVVLSGTALFQVGFWAFMRLLGRPYAFLTMARRLPVLLALALVWGLVLYLFIGRKPARFARERDMFGGEGSRV